MTSIKSFYRQNEALHEALTSDPSKFTFSHEVGPGGKRKFLTANLEDFWKSYISKSSLNRKHYEVIASQSPSKLYYDLEFQKEENVTKDGRELLGVLLEETKVMLRDNFGHQVSSDEIIVLEATTQDKFSLHIIFTRTVFQNNASVGLFVKALKESLTDKHPGFFDVQNKERTISFIDSCVYKTNQNFRLYLSRKFGKSNYLLLSSIMNDSWKIATEEDIFKASIITNVDKDAATSTLKMADFTQISFSPKPISSTSLGSHTAIYKYKSIYHEIEEILLKIVSPGYIRDCIYYSGLSENVVFTIGGTRFCQNVKREHNSNNIYYICNLQEITLVQACHKCIGFRGEKIKLDPQTLSWIDED